MPSTEKLDTHRKALTVNLDASTFGSFAEIGAGQEVALSLDYLYAYLLESNFLVPIRVPEKTTRVASA
jgi:hypothetical protein